MKRTLVLLLTLVVYQSYSQNSTRGTYPISFVDQRYVRLTDRFWKPMLKLVDESTIPHCLAKCEEEGRFENFLIAGGKKQGTVRGKMPFDDTDVYKIIEGASYSLLTFPNPHLESLLDSLITLLQQAQEPDGYLTTWMSIDPMNPPAWWAKKVGVRWLGEEANHELYNSGHLFEAAVAHYTVTGKRNLLDVAIKNADLLVRTFGYGKLTLPPGHQIVETGLVKLYQVTGNEEYLQLAKFFLDIRGDSTTHSLYGPYSQDHKPILQQDEIVGHAVRAVYMYAGMTDIGILYNDDRYLNVVKHIWQTMVERKMYVTGGIGSRHEGESFGDDYELPNRTAYCETCASIGTVLWTMRLFQCTGTADYFTVIERELYNSLIAGLSKDGKNFFYVNPLEHDGEFAFNVGFRTRQPWFECACCPTNIVRFLPTIPRMIYATSGDTLYVNLYVASSATVQLASQAVTIEQKTEYPWKGTVHLKLGAKSGKPLTLKLRIPGWARNVVLPGTLYRYLDYVKTPSTVIINGKRVSCKDEGGYIVLSYQWRQENDIRIEYPMSLRRVVAHDNVVENRNKVALEYGPFVYCAEGIDNEYSLDSVLLSDGSSLRAVMEKTSLGSMVVVKGTVPSLKQEKNLQFTAIPYFRWANRGVSPMKVWFPRKEEER